MSEQATPALIPNEMPLATAEPSQKQGSASPSEHQAVNIGDLATAKRWLFNGDKARNAALKSIEARKRNLAEAAQTKAIVAELRSNAIVEPSEVYRMNQLALVRGQITVQRRLIAEEQESDECDPKRLQALIQGQHQLSEQERLLDGRPLPGSNRPTKPKPTKADAGAYGPVE